MDLVDFQLEKIFIQLYKLRVMKKVSVEEAEQLCKIYLNLKKKEGAHFGKVKFMKPVILFEI